MIHKLEVIIMGGKGSGRKPRIEEYGIEELVRSSIHTVKCALDPSQGLSLKDRSELASRIVQKRIPSLVDVEIKRSLSFEERMALADKLKKIIELSQGNTEPQSSGHDDTELLRHRDFEPPSNSNSGVGGEGEAVGEENTPLE